MKLSHVIIPKTLSAFNSDANPLVARLLFFCNALVISDYATEHTLEVLSSLLIPSCLDIVLFSGREGSLDVQENGIIILISLLQTTSGFQLITQKYSLLLLQVFDLIRSQLDESNEELDRLLQDLVQASNEFIHRYPINRPVQESNNNSSISNSNVQNNHTNDVNLPSEENNVTETIFLIAPPPLEASSRIP